MAAKPCSWCRTPIRFMTIRGGKVLPFEHQLMPRADANDLGWVALKGEDGVYMRPTCEISDRRLTKVRWVAIRHHCEEYQLARMRLAGLDWASGDVKSMLLTLRRPRVPRTGRT